MSRDVIGSAAGRWRRGLAAIVLGLGWLAGGCGPSAPAPPPAVERQAVERQADAPETLVETLDTAGATPESTASPLVEGVPGWAADAVFYQIFPERFANGDPTNDPTRESLEDLVPETWSISPWTGDWYARAAWEREIGDDFFEHGVFHRRYGGDIQGIIDRLGYLQDLGVNALYLNPLFHARSLHKYDGSSFHHIDPHFGPDPEGDLEAIRAETSDPRTWQWTAADRLFLELIRQAHARGIRVIIDGVFNHTGRDFFAFRDLRERQRESPYAEWYTVEAWDDPATPESEFRYRAWWGVETLPEFADTADGDDLHPGPKAYILDITRRWMDPDGDGDPGDGIDGWRLDVARDVPVAFWRDWHATVLAVNPEAYTVAEEWDEASHFLAAGSFDATMNYYGFAFPVKGFLIDGTLSASAASRQLEQRLADHPPEVRFGLLNLVDSHDTDRVASMIVNAGRRPYDKPERFDYDIAVSPRGRPDYEVRRPSDAERRIQRMVALMQMTYVGPPMIYYGTEAGMWGADDPCDRMPMVWPDMRFASQQADPLGRPRTADLVAFDQSLFDFYRAAVHFRRQSRPLRRGGIDFLAADDAAGFLAFRRTADDETLLAAFNRGDAPYVWRIPADGPGRYAQAFTASGEFDKVIVRADAEGTVVEIPPLEAVVLRLERRP
jgi:cyclomaltodextrinase / maltogenic alpha-amylase / neopullulanase